MIKDESNQSLIIKYMMLSRKLNQNQNIEHVCFMLLFYVTPCVLLFLFMVTIISFILSNCLHAINQTILALG